MSEWIIKMLGTFSNVIAFGAFSPSFLLCLSFCPFSMNRFHGTLESIRKIRFLTKFCFYLCDLEHISFPLYLLVPSSDKTQPFTSKVVFIYNISVSKQICVYVCFDPQQLVANSLEKPEAWLLMFWSSILQ